MTIDNTIPPVSDVSMENPIFHLPISDFFLNTKAGIYITDQEDKVIWMNDTILNNSNIIESVRKAITGKPVMETMSYFKEFMVHPKLFLKRIKELVTNKKVFFGEEFLLKDGRTISLDFLPAYHAGVFYGIIWQVTNKSNWETDIAKRNSKTPDTFAEILDNFHIYYCKINKDLDILSCSPFFCQLTGYSEKELLNKSFIDLCASGKRHVKENLQNVRYSFHTTKQSSFEVELQLKDSSRKWMQCHFSHGQNDFTKGMLLLTEITEQKVIQHDLNTARKDAEHAQLAQQQFLASMSHDIRTPLNAIIGMTFLMADTPLSNEQDEYVNILKNASNILLGLLNGVLDFAKIESGRQEVHYREFDLPSLLHSLVDTFSFKLNEKPIKVLCEIDKRIDYYLTGDDVLINQILMNLLNNAEKFTPHGEINLKVSVLKEFESNIWIEFKVEDTGIGISKNKLQDIFKDFIQAEENIHLEYGGSGLGLFICKKLVELLGGQISVDSTLGKGTTFVFAVPFIKNDLLLKKDNHLISSKFDFHDKNARILIVEDNPMNLKYLSTLLSKYHIAFEAATDGNMGLKKSKENYYNLILMDMKLPKMNGMELTACIRENEGPNAATPIILVTAAALQSTVDKAKEIGVNEMLAKPYTPEQLISVLKKYLIEEDDEPEKGFLKPEKDPFQFDKKLDTSYLLKLYGGNREYAMSLFAVFIESMETDWGQLQDAIKNEDWHTLKNLAHKIKPNFSMAGLTWITSMMQEAYDKLKEAKQEEALPIFSEIQKELDEYMPLVKKELERMQKLNLEEVQ